MDRIVLITGQMRSGTSLVAAMVHHMGFQVAPIIPAPAPPSWRSDWEDPGLTPKLMMRHGCSWGIYFERRRYLSRRTGFGGRIAVKSPYLALYREEIERACELPLWILVTRDPADRERSLAAHPQLSETDQLEIRLALEGLKPEIVLQYERLIEEPLTSSMALADALGVEDGAALDRATDMIGYPTEYPCLQSSPL